MTGARHITEAEIKRIDKCLVGTRNEVRNRAVIYFLAYTGCRVQEAFKVSLGDVLDLSSGAIQLRDLNLLNTNSKFLSLLSVFGISFMFNNLLSNKSSVLFTEYDSSK